MEAEAQCAELARLKLVDGVITDDSDIFLFGGQRVFKNMFNQNQVVQCFTEGDLERELGLDRERLIDIAFLLGSDYTEGLPGFGPITSMEVLSEFGTVKSFAEWWRKVQQGKDTEEESAGRNRQKLVSFLFSVLVPCLTSRSRNVRTPTCIWTLSSPIHSWYVAMHLNLTH